MNYIKLATMEYPRHEGDIRLEHPDIPEGLTGETFICPDTYAKVKEVEMPSPGLNQAVYEVMPEQINGEWVQQFNIRELTKEELDFIEKTRKEMLERDFPSSNRPKLRNTK